MNFNYNEQEYEEFPNFKGGEKSLYAKMFHDEKNRIIYGKLIPGASIGVHTHETVGMSLRTIMTHTRFQFLIFPIHKNSACSLCDIDDLTVSLMRVYADGCSRHQFS